MLTSLVCVALAAGEPRFVAHPLITSGVDAALVVPLQDAFRVTAARQTVAPVATFAMKEALAREPGRSCRDPDDRECLTRLVNATGAAWAVIAVAAPEGAGLKLSARVVGPTGATLRESMQLLSAGGREQLEASFTRLFEALSFATLGETPPPAPVVEIAPPPREPVAVAPAVAVAVAAPAPGPLRPISFGLMGAGLAGGVVGAVLLATAEGEASTLRATLSEAGVHPDESSVERAHRLDTQWAAGQVVLVAGAGVLATGLVLFLVGAPARTAGPTVVVVPGNEGLLVGLSGPLP